MEHALDALCAEFFPAEFVGGFDATNKMIMRTYEPTAAFAPETFKTVVEIMPENVLWNADITEFIRSFNKNIQESYEMPMFEYEVIEAWVTFRDSTVNFNVRVVRHGIGRYDEHVFRRTIQGVIVHNNRYYFPTCQFIRAVKKLSRERAI